MYHSKTYQTFICSLGFCLLLMVMLPSADALAALPTVLEAAALDWVCVTDASLADDYEALAVHRRDQGLAALVVDLDEVMLWSPAGDDTTASLRWLAGVAARQWGARYLLLGGSHALLPAPLHRLDSPGYECVSPTDAYYACLDGEWDVDGDGLVAEWADDAPDPAVHLSVGRLPADDPAGVAAAVAKIIAFEARPAAFDGALFVASLMDPQWTPADPYPNWALACALELRDLTAVLRPSLRIGSLFQGPDPVDPLLDPLNPAALVDSLSARAHDLVYFQLMGTAASWELAGTVTVAPGDFEALAGSGHGFVAAMLSGEVADTRGPGILQHLLTLPGGGAVAVVAPTGVGFMFPHLAFQQRLWQRLVDGSCDRLGDAFTGALSGLLDVVGLYPQALSTYWYEALLGDPATLLRPAGEAAVTGPPPARVVHLQAVPNPFNPTTSIRFEVTGPDDLTQPVRVEIFDLQGRRVAKLLEQELPPGPHAVPWIGDQAGGLYFARVRVGAATATVKLTLVK